MRKLNFRNCYNKKKLNKFGDSIFDYQSIWPIFNLNMENKESIFNKLQDKIEKLIDYDDITDEEIDNFLDKNPDIELELDFFANELPNIFLFRMNDEIFCYSTENLEDKNSLVRFYFDYQRFI